MVRKLYNSAGTVVEDYTYDGFGIQLDTNATSLNPFRYCGEYFDEETELIYLRNRYYDPHAGRFTQMDTYWTPSNSIYGDKTYKDGEIKFPDMSAIMQSSNLYVYCTNNPVNMVDKYGENTATIWKNIFSTAASMALFDGPLPYGDVIAGIAVICTGVWVGGPWLYKTLTNLFSDAKSQAISDSISAIKTKDPNDTIIYRIGSGNATNLTPREVDYTGLSYTTVMPTSGAFTITSINTINSTGTLMAIKDGDTHVSVVPVDSSKMQEWISSRAGAMLNPHEYTKILQKVSISIK